MICDDTLLPYFGCTACHVVDVLDLLCRASSRGGALLCVRCCGCEEHPGALEMPGTVIFPPPGEEGR